MSHTSETRSASWRQTQTELTPRSREVMQALTDHPEGMTAWEIADYTHRYVHAVRPRLTEMHADGLVIPVGTRWQEKTSRQEAVWRAVREESDGQRSFA